jgi:pimeloyl-ACP methyl ester carboxylesterase
MEVDGLKFHYKEAGEGRPAMILLHGFSSSTFSWRNVSRSARLSWAPIISYDRPSSGLTERPLAGPSRAWKVARRGAGVNPYSPLAQARPGRRD